MVAAPLSPTAALLEARAHAAGYAEAAYFDGAPVAHCAAFEENRRLRRIARQWHRAARASRRPCPPVQA
jgi:hypothetical protein